MRGLSIPIFGNVHFYNNKIKFELKEGVLWKVRKSFHSILLHQHLLSYPNFNISIINLMRKFSWILIKQGSQCCGRWRRISRKPRLYLMTFTLYIVLHLTGTSVSGLPLTMTHYAWVKRLKTWEMFQWCDWYWKIVQMTYQLISYICCKKLYMYIIYVYNCYDIPNRIKCGRSVR